MEKKLVTERERDPSELKDRIVAENEAIFANSIFQEILTSIDKGWDPLTTAKRRELIDSLGELIENLKSYHDSYIGLKFAASPERHASQDIQRYQESVRNADTREHILHDAFIDAVNILSRKMKSLGLNNEWRANEEIDGLNKEATRQKLKLWMFKIFEERMIEHL